VKHIPGVINASDLFTKEIKDDAHFRRCRDSFMVSRSNFQQFGHCVPAHLTSKALLPYYNLHSKVSPETFAASAARTVSDRPSAARFERGVLLPKQRQTANCSLNSNLSSVVRHFSDAISSPLLVAIK
jgi:hypothetical protein